MVAVVLGGLDGSVNAHALLVLTILKQVVHFSSL